MTTISAFEKGVAERNESLNKDIAKFPNVFPITPEMTQTKSAIQRLVMLDRYAFKDTEKATLKIGDKLVLTVKDDPKFPARGMGDVVDIDWKNQTIKVAVEEGYVGTLDNPEEPIIERPISAVDKPLELYYEQIAKRNAWGLASIEKTEELKKEWFWKFYNQLVGLNFIPAGRVLYGAGSGTQVTFFNCYVMPFVKDSRDGISEHRKQVMEIMSRGGGVGTNGSTLRPRNALAKGVNGKSSGSVSWLDDIAKLTHLVEQGGSRRGAQMIMLSDWHPDVLEFIISKMQNPRILKFIIDTTEDDEIRQLAQGKLNFTPLTDVERNLYQGAVNYKNVEGKGGFDGKAIEEAEQKLREGGSYGVHNPEFLTGANISVCLTKDFMDAVDNGEEYELKFPDTASYSKDEMEYYDEHWSDCGDVRVWEKEHGMRVKTYRKIKAKELWNLINICATYSAEPGIFFIDNANDKTNASSYGQRVVATNPCGKSCLPHVKNRGMKRGA